MFEWLNVMKKADQVNEVLHSVQTSRDAKGPVDPTEYRCRPEFGI